jgi:hypothetical protein
MEPDGSGLVGMAPPYQRPAPTRFPFYIINRELSFEEFDLINELVNDGALRQLALTREEVLTIDGMDHEINKIIITVDLRDMEPHERFPARYSVSRQQTMRRVLETVARLLGNTVSSVRG